MTVYAHDISPDVLEDGFWVLGRDRILHWVEMAQKPAPEPVRPKRVRGIACGTCGARKADWCRTESGKARHDHPERRSPRTCICGAPPSLPKARYCSECRVKVRRETFQQSQQRRAAREAARLEQVYAERFGTTWQTEGEVA